MKRYDGTVVAFGALYGSSDVLYLFLFEEFLSKLDLLLSSGFLHLNFLLAWMIFWLWEAEGDSWRGRGEESKYIFSCNYFGDAVHVW